MGATKPQQGWGVLQQASDVMAASCADQSVIAGCVVKKVGSILPQALVGVHAGTVISENRLGHESGYLTVSVGDVFHHVFLDHHIIGHFGQGIVSHIDFSLPGRSYLMVMFFHHDAEVLQLLHALGTQVL